MRRIGQGLRDWYLTHGARGALREALVVVGFACLLGGIVAMVGDPEGGMALRLIPSGFALFMISAFIRRD